MRSMDCVSIPRMTFRQSPSLSFVPVKTVLFCMFACIFAFV